MYKYICIYIYMYKYMKKYICINIIYICKFGCCFSTLRCFQMYTDMSDATFLYVSLLRKLALNKPEKGKGFQQQLKVEETSGWAVFWDSKLPALTPACKDMKVWLLFLHSQMFSSVHRHI